MSLNKASENFIEQKERYKVFLKKAEIMMYVMIVTCLALAIFFYAIFSGYMLFLTAIMIILAMIGAVAAVDARKQSAELDDFALFYGLNKLRKHGKEKI